jgi:hypothetical protein
VFDASSKYTFSTAFCAFFRLAELVVIFPLASLNDATTLPCASTNAVILFPASFSKEINLLVAFLIS